VQEDVLVGFDAGRFALSLMAPSFAAAVSRGAAALQFILVELAVLVGIKPVEHLGHARSVSRKFVTGDDAVLVFVKTG